MGRCNPITKTCTRTPWWRSALGVDWIGGSGGGGEEPAVEPFLLIAYDHNPSNKFVDLYFNRGVYASGGAITTSNFSLAFTVGGASALSILSVKKPDHHVSASATNLSGGESVIRVFLTLTGTPDSTEFYSIATTGITDIDGDTIDQSTGNIYLGVLPFNLWDAQIPTLITTTGLGVSTFTDLMGNTNLTQGTDADRPLYNLDTSIQFDSANTEWLVGGTNAAYAITAAGSFSIALKNLKTNLGTAVGWVIGYFHGTTNNGWAIRFGGANSGFILLIFDGTNNKSYSFNAFEDQCGNFIITFTPSGWIVYDENNNIVGSAAASGTLGNPNYTGVSLFVGRRETNTTNYFNGSWDQMAFYSQSFSEGQREVILNNMKRNFINQSATLTKYMFPMLNGSTNPSAGDTMQAFVGDVVLKDGVYHMFYTGNNATGDIDTGFKATKVDDGSNDPFVKVLDGGLPKAILSPSAVNGTYDEDQVFIRTVLFDEDDQLWKMYFSAEQTGANPVYTVGLATSENGEDFTKVGQIYTAGAGVNVIYFAVCKAATGDYRAIASVRSTAALSNYEHRYLTSTDGETWALIGTFTLPKSIIYVSSLYKIGDEFFFITNHNNRDSAPSNTDDILIYKTTDFTTVTLVGKLMTKHEPSERSHNTAILIPRTSTIEVFYTYTKNQNKKVENGGEGYSAVRRAILNKPILQQPTTVIQYPTHVKKYWPLNRESCIDNTFYEYIDGQTTTFAGTKQWSIDGLNFFDFLGTGFSFPAIDLTGYTDDLALKMRVEIVTTGTINLFSIGTDIVVQLVSGNLRVALNNGTKDYITTADIAKPTGIDDVGTHVYVGFIWQGGVLKLCVGNTIDIADTQTVNNAMTDIANGGSPVIICESATIEAGRVVLMSGQTDQQWIDTDL